MYNRNGIKFNAEKMPLVQIIVSFQQYMRAHEVENITVELTDQQNKKLNDIANLYAQLSDADKASFIEEVSRQARAIVPHTPHLKRARAKNFEKKSKEALIMGAIGGTAASALPELAATFADQGNLLTCCCKTAMGAFLGGIAAVSATGFYSKRESKQLDENLLGKYTARMNEYRPFEMLQNALNIDLIPANPAAPRIMSMD